MIKPKIILFLFVTLAYSQVLGQPAIDEDRISRYDYFIENLIEEEEIPGAVVMINVGGKTAHKKAYGKNNLLEQRSMGDNDIFYIQSMTKPIISVAFMMLYEEGHFLLTDPVSKYIPEFKNLRVCVDPEKGLDGPTEPLESEITIVQLLTHTAGISHGLSGVKLDQDLRKAMTQVEYKDIRSRIDAFLKLPIMNQPGKQWMYSGAPDVLSVLIEQFSGMSTKDFLQKRIFDPLEMKNTGYNVPVENSERIVKLHQKNEEGNLIVSNFQPKSQGNTVWSGVNALFSTASDYMNFCQMLLNGGRWNGHQLLGRKTVELMTVNHVSDLFHGPGSGFGLGFSVVTNLADTNILGSEGVYGWGGAFNTQFFIDPKEELIAIFMTQTLPYDDFYNVKMKQFVYQALY